MSSTILLLKGLGGGVGGVGVEELWGGGWGVRGVYGWGSKIRPNSSQLPTLTLLQDGMGNVLGL